jgi:hypothetical protein
MLSAARSMKILAAALLSAVAVGCGSSGGTADAGAGGATGGGGHTEAGMDVAVTINPELYWKDDGVVHSSAYVEAIRTTGATSDDLEIVGSGTKVGVDALTLLIGGTALGGTYNCPYDGGNIVEITYDLAAPTTSSCTVTLTFTTGADGHEHATGTFEADLTFTDGGTKHLTEGVFDIPDMRTGG